MELSWGEKTNKQKNTVIELPIHMFRLVATKPSNLVTTFFNITLTEGTVYIKKKEFCL